MLCRWTDPPRRGPGPPGRHSPPPGTTTTTTAASGGSGNSSPPPPGQPDPSMLLCKIVNILVNNQKYLMHYKIFVYSNTRQQSARQTAPVPLGPYRSVENLYLWDLGKISSQAIIFTKKQRNSRKKYLRLQKN